VPLRGWRTAAAVPVGVAVFVGAASVADAPGVEGVAVAEGSAANAPAATPSNRITEIKKKAAFITSTQHFVIGVLLVENTTFIVEAYPVVQPAIDKQIEELFNLLIPWLVLLSQQSIQGQGEGAFFRKASSV
jgi:hypothetical protein